MKFILLKLVLVISIWIIAVQINSYDIWGVLEFFGFLIGITFIPIIALDFYRNKKKRKIKSLHKVFRFCTWLFIALLAIYAISPYILFYYSYISSHISPYYNNSWDIKESFIIIWPPLVIIALLSLLLKINAYLIPKNERTKIKLLTIIKQNKERVIVICAIVMVFIYGWHQWHMAGQFDSFLWESGGYGDMMLDAISRQHFYELAFMKLTMFGGFVFGSLLLLMNVFKKK